LRHNLLVADSDSTCWTVIRGAAAGRDSDRAEFARRYAPVIRAYLGARWRGTNLLAEIDDMTQEVFVDCFKDDGALGRVEPGPRRVFRALLKGVVNKVARRAGHARAKAARPRKSEFDPPADEATLSCAFDQAWALTLVRQAVARQAEIARDAGPEARRRVDLLRLRFHDDLPIRKIARIWAEDSDRIHRWYRKAREEFRAALNDVVKEHNSGTPAEIDRECSRLLALFA
jgi:DNA-directed RNA polymerase specialized sigma24 family protein